jgi:cell division protein FtsB
MTDEPTLGEAMRRLDAVARQLDALAKTMADDRRDFASTYVRYDVYTARHSHLETRVKDLEDDSQLKEKTAAETRRQFVFLVLGIAIPAVIGLLLGIASITGTPSP